MKLALFCALIAAALSARADPLEAQRQIERALIQRDQQAAEFARPALRDFDSRSVTRPVRPDERALRTREREAYLLSVPQPASEPGAADARPLPLPGGPRHGVDPIPVQGLGG